MSDRTKELILKTLIVIVLTLIVMVFPGCLIWHFFIPEKILLAAYDIMFFGAMGLGFLFTILLPIFGGMKSKSVKADKAPLPFTSYGELVIFLQKRLSTKGYRMQKTVSISTDGEIAVYVYSPKLWTLECFVVVRVSQLSEDLINYANESITNILTEYYNGKRITDTINMISVFCVDRITPSFQKLVNGNVEQGLKNGRLPVGISFGGKKIYIAKQTDGFAIAKYKRLRRQLIDIMNLQDAEWES